MKKKNEKNELSDDKLEKVSAGQQEEKEIDPNKAIPDNDPNNRRINPQL